MISPPASSTLPMFMAKRGLSMIIPSNVCFVLVINMIVKTHTNQRSLLPFVNNNEC